jgi:hypothetical protein
MLNRLPLPLRNFLTTLLAFTGGYLAATGAYDIWQGRADPPSFFITSLFVAIAAGSALRSFKIKKTDEPTTDPA